jgi:hypothetical protein
MIFPRSPRPPATATVGMIFIVKLNHPSIMGTADFGTYL